MPEQPRGIYGRLIAFIRQLAWTGIVALLVLLAIWYYIHTRVHEQIRGEIERRFRQHYAKQVVTVRSARLVEGRGIEIYGVVIRAQPDGPKLVQIDEIFAACGVKLEDLLSGQEPPTQKLSIRGLRISAERQADGTWNIEPLWPLPSFGTSHPPVSIEDGAVELSLAGQGAATSWNLRRINLTVTPEPRSPEADSERSGAARPAATAITDSGRRPGPFAPPEPESPAPTAPRASPARPSPPGLLVEGQLRGDHFESLRFQGRLNPHDRSWNVQGDIRRLQLSQALVATCPQSWQSQLGPAASLRGTLGFDFEAHSGANPNEPVQFAVNSGLLTEGEIVDARLPLRLHDVQARFACDNRGLKVESLTARSGETTLKMTLERGGWAGDSPLVLRAQARQFVLSPNLVEVLPPNLQATWRKFFPVGRIDADLQLTFDGQRWVPEYEVQCLDVAFEYHKFPYRLEGTRGRARLQAGVLDLDLTSLASGQVVHLKGQFTNPGENYAGEIEISCDGPVPIDEKLLSAIVDRKAQEVIRALHPGGTFIFKQGRFGRTTPNTPIHRSATIEIHNGTLEYDKFRYPVSTVEGTLEWDDSGWNVKRLTGRNHSGALECTGRWTAREHGGGQLVLNILGSEVPLEDALREALSPGVKRLWNDLRPTGSIDILNVNLKYDTADGQVRLALEANKWKKAGNEGYNISLQPVWFPYRVEEVVGSVLYRDGLVTLKNISGVHNDTEVSVAGDCSFDDRGGWRLNLTTLNADRLHLDREFLGALPPTLGKGITKLNLQGAVNVRGSLGLAGAAGRDGNPAAQWDLVVDMENGGLRSALQLDHIHGEVRLFGESDQKGFYSRGELNVDSLVYRDVQLTQVRGPLLIDAKRLGFGVEAERGRVDQAPRSVSANGLGGVLSVDANVDFEGDMGFQVRTQLERGDLAQVAQELAWKNPNIRGKANAVLNLKGSPLGPHTWRGGGLVRLYDADIYEIPVMLALLKVISIRRPDTTAFTSSEIDFRLQGEDVYFDRINFNGDAISLRGRGEMNLNRQIALTFYTLVGHGELRPAMLRAILRTASKQLLMIRVTGSLDEPRVAREPLPMLKETIDLFLPEVATHQGPQRLPTP